MQININDLEVGELEQVEEIAGAAISELFTSGGMSAKGLLAIITVWSRRENPEFTVDDARRVKFKDVEVVTEADPTE